MIMTENETLDLLMRMCAIPEKTDRKEGEKTE